MAFKIFYKASVEKDLRQIDKTTAKRLLNKLGGELSRNPSKGEPLKGEFQGLLKYRIGDYRVIYTRIPEGVLILRIAHRQQAYRK